MKPTLYEIAVQYRADVAKLCDLDLDDQTIADTLDGMQGELTVKARNIAAIAADLDASAAAMREAEKRMKDRRQAVERRAERLRHHLLHGMQVAGVHRIESPDVCVTLKANPPSVDVFEPALVPAEYMRQPEPPPPAVDKAAVREALKRGQDVPGCRLTSGVRIEIA